jgi:hypothetical protein
LIQPIGWVPERLKRLTRLKLPWSFLGTRAQE